MSTTRLSTVKSGQAGVGITTRDHWNDLAVTLSELRKKGYGDVRTTVVSDDTLPAVFSKLTDKVAELLRICGVIALKPKLDNTNLAEVMELIRDLVAE
jgi:hypothetical protein